MEKKKTFEPFERVIYRPKGGHWRTDFVSFDGIEFCHLIGAKRISKKEYNIIPFAGNEHLVGTTDMPNEEVELKKGELVFVFDDIECLEDFVIGLRKFAKICGDTILAGNGFDWKYCIPFSQFNPNDMEETRKHILCMKNGKLIKARV